MSDGAPVRLSALRRAIAVNMERSLAEAAQLTLHATINATAIAAVRARAKAEDRALGYEDFVLKALADVLPKHGALNAWLEGEMLRRFTAVAPAIAMDVDGGLAAPALPNISGWSIDAIAAARRALQARARERNLTAAEMTGGSITVSNLGHTRVEHFTPILKRPQVALIGLGRMARAAVVTHEGALAAGWSMGLSLSFDHRAVDGEPAGLFLTALCEALEAPDALI